MKYLMIENRGEISPYALTLMGASTKREDKTKIGYFGSGNKYAVAVLLKLGIPFHIYSGTTEIEVHTEEVLMSEQSFDKIYFQIGDRRYDTSLTIQMGPQWEPWYAVREIYCNAIDEGQCNILPMVEELSPREGFTRFYIGITEPIEPVVTNWNKYFAIDRVDILSELPGVKLFFKQATGMRIYRKGILVFEDDRRNALFDYDMEDAFINEMRVLTSTYSVKHTLQSALAVHGDRNVIKRILLGLHLAQINNQVLFESDMEFGYGMTANRDAWFNAVQGFQFVNANLTGKYPKESAESNTLVLSHQLISEIRDKVDPNITTYGVTQKQGSKTSYKSFYPNADQLISVNKAVAFLATSGIELGDIAIEYVEFDTGNRLGGIRLNRIGGAVDITPATILLGSRVFDKGVKEIACTILEEYAHITTHFEDETRELQSYFLDKWVTEMEKRTGQYL